MMIYLFRILLMHQPSDCEIGVKKTETSGINVGDRDFNIAWGITLQ